MPHSIIQTGDGSFMKVPGTDATLLTNIIISLEIAAQSWWNDPAFGLKKRRRKKNTPQTARLLADDSRRALQWLLDSKRATAIDIIATLQPNAERYRLKLAVAVMAATGQLVTFDKFVEVI